MSRTSPGFPPELLPGLLTELLETLSSWAPFWCLLDRHETVIGCSPAWSRWAGGGLGRAVHESVELTEATEPAHDGDSAPPQLLQGRFRSSPDAPRVLLTRLGLIGHEVLVGRLDLSRNTEASEVAWSDVCVVGGDLDLMVLHDETGLALSDAETALELARRENDLLRRSLARFHAVSRERRQTHAELQAKSEFLAHLSHELRNPVTGILGFLEILEWELDPQWASLAEDLRRATRHVMTLLDDTLTMEKMNAGGLVPQIEALDPGPIVRNATRLFAVAAAEKGIELITDVPTGMPDVLADQRLLERVLTNLVGNAVKFTEAGMVRVVVCTRGEAATTPEIVVEVQDTGVGMDEEELERIFEPYRQARHDTWKKRGGTGLGLSISRRLVEAMHGRVEVDSLSGSGSVFEVSLPSRPAVPADGRADGRADARLPIQARSLSVLVSHPHAHQSLALRRALESHGCEVHVSAHAAVVDALLRERERGFDLWLCAEDLWPGLRDLRGRVVEEEGADAPRVHLIGRAGARSGADLPCPSLRTPIGPEDLVVVLDGVEPASLLAV